MRKKASGSICCFVFLFLSGFSSTVCGQESAKTNLTSLIPILGNYANKSVPLGGSLTLTPDTGASNIGTATVSVSGNFKGSVTVSPYSGAVRVLNAYPIGNYTVTVRGADFAGFSVTRSFTLSVTNVSTCSNLAFAGIGANVGINPSGLVTADFNGDGRQDAATANQSSNNISVLLGNGAGSFGTVTNFDLPVGAISPFSIAFGDFNGDNRADLAVGNLFAAVSHVAVYIGTGTGNFAAPVNNMIGTSSSILSIAIGDFNGDGRQDIVTRNAAGSSSILFRNAANNGFDAATTVNIGSPAFSIAPADFNADGRHDLVASRTGQNVVVALIRNAANNGFDQVSLTISGSAQHVAVGDFTGDGRQDIAVSYSGGLDILPRNTLGFDAPIPATAAVSSPIEVGDFTGDGRLDLAFLSSGGVAILPRNAANTSFDSQFFAGNSGFQMNRIVAGDFTSDGRADIAMLNIVSGSLGSVSVLRRSGTNPNYDLSPVTTLGSTNFTDTALGDFDNDGRQDLATATLNSSTISIYKGSAGGLFANLTTAVLSNGSTSNGRIIAADFNNDGNTDLVVGNLSFIGFSLLQGVGNGSFEAAIDFPLGLLPLRFGVGDFNGDGRQDLAINRQNAAQTTIFLRNAANSGFETAVTINQIGNPNSLAVGDFNNDGNDDFAVGFSGTNFSVILRNAANNGFDAPVVYSTFNGNTQLTAADFDGDGNLDIAAAQNDVSVYYGSATGVFGAPTVHGVNLTANYVETGDFNGDGRQDIAAAVSSYFGSSGRANIIVLLRNPANDGFDPAAGFNGSYILSNSQTQRILVGEVNGDGRQDLITSNGTNNALQASFSVMPRVCAVDLNLLGALPNANAGQNYTKTIYANGGIAPYNFTVSGLPSGLNFSTTPDSVTIFGNPSAGGQFNVSVGISDSNPFAETKLSPQAANSLTQILPLHVAFVPTAANVSVSGRVSTADGRILRGAIVTLTDANGATRTTRSTTFGSFQFEEVEVGQTYVVGVRSKTHLFAPRIITVDEEITELNLTANE